MNDFFGISIERPNLLWLLLSVPLLVALSWRPLAGLERGQRPAVLLTRCGVILLVVVCIAGIETVRTNQNLTVLFLLDRSHSIPKELYAIQEEYVAAAARTMPPNDKVGVLTFDGQSYVEQLPMRGGIFFETLPETSLPDQTDMAGATRMAMALLPHDTAKRIVIVSDGNNNVGDVLAEIEAAAANGIGVDVLPMTYLHTSEVYLEKLYVPASANDGDLVPLRAFINSRRAVTGTLTLLHNGVPLELPEEVARQNLHAGTNAVPIKVPVHGNGPHRFELTFHPDHDRADTLVENNKGIGFTFVGGNQKILILTANADDDAELVRALRQENIELDFVKIENAEDLDLLGFMQYSAVLLSNIGANWFTDEQIRQLAVYVEDMGHGLIMTGGDEGFGAGGWIGTPLEAIMPVDFEIKHRQVLPRGGLVIIMHSCEMPRGNYWGKRVAEKAVETISSKDYFGLLCYSHLTGISWEVPVQVASNKTGIKNAIQRMSNGDMPDFKKTMDMAVDALMELKDAAQRHIIIISDGDAQPPSQTTIAYMKEQKITCSTVGIGYGVHVQEGTLRQIATQTGGRFYPGRNPRKLPQIFVKESKVIRRPLLVEQPFKPAVNYAMSDLWMGLGAQTEIPPLGGLVMTSPKQSGLVEMPLVRRTAEGDDPLLAHWQVGLGRAVAFTSGYWTHWGQDWTHWAKFGKLWAQVLRWTMSPAKRGEFDIATRLDGNRGTIVVEALDKDANYMNYLDLQATVAKPGGLGTEQVRLTQTAPGRYEGTFAVEQTGQYVANISLAEGGKRSSVAHTGLAVAYSPEYKELSANEPLLRRIVEITGGRFLERDPQQDDVFRHDLPESRSHQPVWAWVLAWLLLPLFLFDVAARRLASTVALSVVVEVLLDVVLLFGLGIIYARGATAVWGTLGVVLLGELVGWTIRRRSIRPAIESLIHPLVVLAGAGRSSASSLEQLKGTRERVQEHQTSAGSGTPLTRIAPRGTEATAEGSRRFDTGEPTTGSGDLREALGGPAAGETPGGGPERPAPAKPPKISDDFTSRLLQARRRARQQMRDDDDTPGPTGPTGATHGDQD